MNLTEYLVKGSNNKINLNVLENGADPGVTPTQIDIVFFGPFSAVVVATISRSPTGAGVTYSAGAIEIDPGLLTESLDELLDGRIYRVEINITTGADAQGVVFGGPDSGARLYFHVSTAAA